MFYIIHGKNKNSFLFEINAMISYIIIFNTLYLKYYKQMRYKKS